MISKPERGFLQTALGLLLLLAFCGLCTLCVMLGARAYTAVSNRLERQYGVRTCLSYISARLRGFDGEQRPYLTDFGEVYALALEERLEGQTYVTYIYGYQGSVYELFARKDSGLEPSDGLEVIRGVTPRFEAAYEGLLLVHAVPQEEAMTGSSVYVSLQSAGGQADAK